MRNAGLFFLYWSEHKIASSSYTIENYQNMTVKILQVMSNIKGIDMVDLEEKIMRSGAYSTLVPVVRSKVGVMMVIFDILVWSS